MIVKVDLEKAYDLVDWGFLIELLRFLGFNHHLQGLILTIIRSMELTVCSNGACLMPFRPSRGLHQGDLLSPYLFVLCMETLSNRILTVVGKKYWRPVWLGKDGVAVSQLFFADYLLLMGEVSFSQAQVMEHVLDEFCAESGQCLNRHKSIVWFSLKVPTYLRNSICSKFGVKASRTLGHYLGVPLGTTHDSPGISSSLWRNL